MLEQPLPIGRRMETWWSWFQALETGVKTRAADVALPAVETLVTLLLLSRAETELWIGEGLPALTSVFILEKGCEGHRICVLQRLYTV